MHELPNVPLMPATITIETYRPVWGWWNWKLHIKEAMYRSNTVIPWLKSNKKAPRTFDLELHCSHAFDPVPDLHWFVECIFGTTNSLWEVDEEGRFVTFIVNYLNYRTVQMRIFSTGYSDDYCFDLVLDRETFLKEISSAYYSFGQHGGWGDYGDMACYVDFPGDAIQIDQEAFEEIYPQHSVYIQYDDFVSMKLNMAVGDDVQWHVCKFDSVVEKNDNNNLQNCKYDFLYKANYEDQQQINLSGKIKKLIAVFDRIKTGGADGTIIQPENETINIEIDDTNNHINQYGCLDIGGFITYFDDIIFYST